MQLFVFVCLFVCSFNGIFQNITRFERNNCLLATSNIQRQMPSVCPSSWPVGQVLTLIVLFIGGVSGGMPTGAVLLRWICMGLFHKHIRLNLSRRIHGTGIDFGIGSIVVLGDNFYIP